MRRRNTMYLTAPEIVITRGSSPPTWTREGGFWRDEHGFEYSEVPVGFSGVWGAKWVPVVDKVFVSAGWALSILFPAFKQARQ